MTRLIAAGGHEVIAFSDGLKALARITEDSSVRTLITSTEPLNISGVELCTAARKISGTRRALHVILMSATNDYYLAVTALDNGADDFIHKPPIADELRARLRLADRVTAMKRQLIEYATIDSLTGVFNRRAFFDSASERSAIGKARPVCSAIMFDIDHFKRINDIFGHEVGDDVLAAVGAQLKRTGRIAGRLGGEEFCVITDGDLADALNCAAELAESFRTLRFNHAGRVFTLTCSFGVAEWKPHETIDQMLRRADIAMYHAKKAGRDRVVASDHLSTTSLDAPTGGVTRAHRRQ
jgi:two-component system cell cycle response regulator